MPLRKIKITPGFIRAAEGSALIECGRTRVVCTASVTPGVPRFREASGAGWVTAEYGMLPRSTGSRMEREAAKGRQGGRTVEIGRLIGRSLRAAVDMEALGPNTINIDCDVIEADGGTRCASITGGMVALYQALRWMEKKKMFAPGARGLPLRHLVAAVSVGIVGGRPTLDLCYEQDSRAEVDMNFVMTDDGRFVEIQGTAEREPFSEKDLAALKKLAAEGIRGLVAAQKKALKIK